MKRTMLVMIVGLVSLIGGMTPAIAGGWVIVELVNPLPEVTAGEAVTFDVLVQQHGVTPYAGGDVTLSATNRETLTTITVDAEELAGKTGVYRFDVTFPVAGTWKWHVSVSPFPGMTAFPPLLVTGAVASPVAGLPVEAGTTQIVISDLGFSPASVTIAAGTVVEWTNSGVLPHQVAGSSLDFDDSPLLQPGETYRFTFEMPGTYDYICGPHPQMQGTITVE
jgi:plastocyanin